MKQTFLRQRARSDKLKTIAVSVRQDTSMGLYANWVLPRLPDLAMRNQALDRYRRNTIASARGVVLEVGVGSGLNLPLYGRAVGRVFALDPSLELLCLARQRAREAVVRVSLVRASAEGIPFFDGAFDSVVMTWTL